MRNFLSAIKDLPHPEERPQGASRRTHDARATLSELVFWISSEARKPESIDTGLRQRMPASPIGANLGASSPATTTSRLSPRRKPGPINADVECPMFAARQYADEELPFIERALNLVVRVPE